MSKKSPTVSKPHKDFPLFPHATGRWAKKVRGKLHYFGKTSDDPHGEAAIQRWNDERDAIFAGRTPRRGTGLMCRDLCNSFLASKEMLVESGDITRPHWKDYHGACDRLLRCFGKATPVESLMPEDFDRLRADIAKKWGPIALGNEVQRIRTVFKWALDNKKIEKAADFGQNFKRPSKKVRRLARKAAGPKLFTADELRAVIGKAETPMKAMVLLGINCGLGQHDIATLPINRLDLVTGWHNYERIKTGTDRRCALWPETIVAIQDAIATRRKPKSDADSELVFISDYGHRWVRCRDNGVWVDLLGKEFLQLVRSVGVTGTGKTFYTLRRTFRTVADESGDQIAASLIMGHVEDDDDMASIYRQSVSDTRLKAVTDYVRKWLWPKGRKAK